ncbi:hypothetical protein FHS10_001811 [Mucilaginibacter dorajii]|nr:hypothetical protein [Mucilaginibacter dorajii]
MFLIKKYKVITKTTDGREFINSYKKQIIMLRAQGKRI